MTARTWTEGDSQPSDVSAVVDQHGHTWLWRFDAFEDVWHWQEQRVTHYPGGLGHGFSTSDWEWLVDVYGPVREATADEAEALTVAIAPTPDAGVTPSTEGA